MAGVSFHIRQFQKADFDTLWQIDQACFDPQLAYSRPELAFYMRRSGSFTLVAQNAPQESAEKFAEKIDEASGKASSHAAGNGNSKPQVARTTILGFIIAESRRKNGHIITIDVVAEARRAGVGSALLDAAEDQLLRAGAVTVALETPINNEPAIRFYKQKGYFVEKTSARYYSNQLDALVMAKDLAHAAAK